MTPMRQELEVTLAEAVKDGKLPHAIVHATNKDGSFQYSFATGLQHYGVNDEPIQQDAVLMLASQSKLLTSIAAMQFVEQGFIGLDDDVSPHIPELSRLGILRGFDDQDNPILEQPKKVITLRTLLTHSSGASYPMLPDTLKHQRQRGLDPAKMANASTILERFDSSLCAEPGESWMYSPGLDWTGLLIKRVSGLDLEAWMQKNMWPQLGVNGITFWPKEKDELKNKVPQLTKRTVSGGLAPDNDENINSLSTDCFGGHGIYAKIPDYLKVLQSLLANDGKLLKPESVDALFTPQLGESSAAALNSFVQSYSSMLVGEFDTNIPMQHGLGGIIFMADDKGRRKRGTMSWGGLVNPFWMIDREAGLAMTFGTQVMPPGDMHCKEMTGIAERAIYKMAGIEV